MTEAYWSKDPTKYIWRIQCQGYYGYANGHANVCAAANVRLSMYSLRLSFALTKSSYTYKVFIDFFFQLHDNSQL
jgi:hypothetical protein